VGSETSRCEGKGTESISPEREGFGVRGKGSLYIVIFMGFFKGSNSAPRV
jgi:hypothetical protein